MQLQEIAVELPAAGSGGPGGIGVAGGAGGARQPRAVPLLSRMVVPLLAGIFTVLAIAGLQYASSLLVPIAVAVLLTLLLGPLVRWMGNYGVAEPVGAALIVFGTMSVLGTTILVLATPAAEWLRRAPQTMHRVEGKLQTIEPVATIQATAASVARVTSVAGGSDSTATRIEVAAMSPLRQFGWTTAHMISGIFTVVFLTYFLLASGSMFRRKIAYLFPSGTQRTRIKRALFEIEEQMSRYLLINTLISGCVATATWAFLAAIGMPNPFLWGVVAGVLNNVPYIGSLITLILIGFVALASFDGSGVLLLACGGFILIHIITCNLLAPMVLGRKMPLNTVAVLISLLFWGWVWGIVGVIMAVPITVMIQVVCTHSERFRGVSILLGNWGAHRIS